MVQALSAFRLYENIQRIQVHLRSRRRWSWEYEKKKNPDQSVNKARGRMVTLRVLSQVMWQSTEVCRETNVSRYEKYSEIHRDSQSIIR